MSDTLDLSVHPPASTRPSSPSPGTRACTPPPPRTRAPWPSSNRASRHLVLDLTHLDRVDSPGLSTLITLPYATREAGGSLRLARIPGRLMRMVTLTGISHLLPVYATVADALAARPETSPVGAAGADHLPD